MPGGRYATPAPVAAVLVLAATLSVISWGRKRLLKGCRGDEFPVPTARLRRGPLGVELALKGRRMDQPLCD